MSYTYTPDQWTRPGEPGYELRQLSENASAQINQEYAAGLGPNGSATIANIPPSRSGVVTKLKFISSGNICIDGWLRISYDNGVTFPFSCELGALFGSRPGDTGSASGPFIANCLHLSSQMASLGGGGFIFEGDFTYPIPFTQGLVIQLFNPTPYDYSGAVFWSEVTVAYCEPRNVPRMQLRSSSSSMNFGGLSANNFAFNSAGFTLANPNVAMNGENSGNALQLTPSQVGQLADVRGAGWAVGLAYTAQGTTGDLSYLERDFGWYIDGVQPPVPGGLITTPTNGAPFGAGIGQPTMLTTGTEDTFDSCFFGFANVAPATIYSKRTAMSTGNGSATRTRFYNAFLDILASANGYRYNTSLALWLLAESHCTATHALAWSLLYYADLSGNGS